MTTTLDYATRIDELEHRLAARRAELHDLATMGAVITSITELDAILSVVMDMSLRLVDGEVGFVMEAEGEDLAARISWGVGEEFVRSLHYADDLDLPTWVYTNRETVLLSDLDLRTDDGMQLNSLIASPIQVQDNCLGVMIIINKSGGTSFTADDQEKLEVLLNFLAVAIQNTQLIKARMRQQQMEQELLIARQVQTTILPSDLAQMPGLQIGTVYQPAQEVGGDFYDVIRLGEKNCLVVLGDVSSKGVPAALVMTATSALIHSVVDLDPNIDVANLMMKVNDLLSTSIIKDREMFVTMFFARFDLEQGELSYCNGGHVPGLFWDAAAGEVRELALGGPIVGAFVGAPFSRGAQQIKSGDRLFLFTDGLTEAADRFDNLFGRERAEAVFVEEINLAPQAACERVRERIATFAEGASEESYDDFTVVQAGVD